MAYSLIFYDFNDYDTASMSMVMVLVREMVQNLKISLRGVHRTHISFLGKILELSFLLSIHDYVFFLFMIVWGWPPGQSDLVLLSGHSISFLLISDSSKYTKLKSTDSNMYHHDHFCLIVMMMRMIILAGLTPGAVFIYCWSLQIWLLYDYSIHRDQWRGGPYQCPLKGTKRSQKNISMITSYCSLLPIPPPKRDVRVSEKPPFSLEHKNTNRSNETRTKKNAQLQIDGICTLWIIFYSKRTSWNTNRPMWNKNGFNSTI